MTTAGFETASDSRVQEMQQRLTQLLDGCSSQEIPKADVCAKIARCYADLGDSPAAIAWLRRLTNAPDSFLAWNNGALLLDQLIKDGSRGLPTRKAKVWVASTYTSAQFASLLKLAGLRHGLTLDVLEGGYDQLRQDALAPGSSLYSAAPDVVVVAPHAGDLRLPEFSDDPAAAVEAELSRWTAVLSALAANGGSRIVLHNFASPPANVFGHLSQSVKGSRAAMIRHLNERLGEQQKSGVSIVDCEGLSALIGKRVWFSDRYWYAAKQAVSLEALPLLARHTASVIAAQFGLSKKCLVLDLDNTLWGGVVGEDGVNGVKIGQGDPVSEAFLAFQAYIKGLQGKGVILAVCSKNNDADAREPFAARPEMLLRVDDFAVFAANWRTKSDNLRDIAKQLNIGLDALVFVDDNPAEREVVRRLAPEVEVLTIGPDPADYLRALAECTWLETAAFTQEDADRTAQYRARNQAADLEAAAGNLEEFYQSLQMEGAIAPIDDASLARCVQLLGKTNQFNLTTRRHSESRLRAMMANPAVDHFTLTLNDRFASHGLVSLLIAEQAGADYVIDTWLMSCRVLGRTVENGLLSHVRQRAIARGCRHLIGVYAPTAKNAMVSDLYERFGFEQLGRSADEVRWGLDLSAPWPHENTYVRWRQANGLLKVSA